MPRLRVRFGRGPEVKFISHLDIMRFWERAFRRAQIPLAYSEGFSPHPQISLATPLPVGVTSEAELMDVLVSRWVSPQWFTAVVNQQLTPGFDILGVLSIIPTTPSLQSRLRHAEYQVEVPTDRETQDIESAISRLLSLESLPWHHQRDTGQRNYDLRTLIDGLWLVAWRQPYGTIGMRLRCDSGGSGRPEQVTSALGFTDHPQSIHRTKLILGSS
ncbi:MAG: TIGR03936 family radical SAM-associated protein [Dehalococcoidales bacterium]|nr:TIGR03936 family radical SAM-associated protein [Dehalococcoidales bacterium]MDP6737473.1 TIGR03936 family radical SAM-associated protein [Dehalococcoidales bacterium]